MKSFEQVEYEQAMDRIKYPKPVCKKDGCGNDNIAFNNGFCLQHKKANMTNQEKEKCEDCTFDKETCLKHTEDGRLICTPHSVPTPPTRAPVYPTSNTRGNNVGFKEGVNFKRENHTFRFGEGMNHGKITIESGGIEPTPPSTWEEELENIEKEYPMAIYNWSPEDWKKYIKKLIKSLESTIRKEERGRLIDFIDAHYLEYCRIQNGRDDCKNCGLDLEDIKTLLK